jgi:hypothetical protein
MEQGVAKRTYQGSCHCGRVRFEADLDLAEGTGRCNCSFCSKSRWWGVNTNPEGFRLLAGEGELGDYQFATMSGHHRFCRNCGLHVFGHGYVEQLGGEFRSVSVAALDGLSDAELAALPIQYGDGRNNNWMNPPAETRHL